MSNRIIALIAFVSVLIAVSEAANCYENWSRCTPQTSAGTGVLWKSCPDYCRKCRQRASGACQRVNNKQCSGGYQCQCSGGKIKDSANWFEKLTCKMGL